MERWQQAVDQTMADNGLPHPWFLVLAFLELLEHDHTQRVASGDKTFSDGLAGLTRERATSLAESIRNYARLCSAMNLHNAKIDREAASRGGEHQSGYLARAERTQHSGQLLKALADMLDHFIPLWNAQGHDTKQGFKTLFIGLRKPGEGPPDDDQTGGGTPSAPVRP